MVNKLLDYAKAETEQINIGESFALKDLFKGYEWKRIKQGDKSVLGTLFMNFAQSTSYIEITKSGNGIIYRKK